MTTLKIDGAKNPQGGMTPHAIVVAFNGLKDGLVRLLMGSKSATIHTFAFEDGCSAVGSKLPATRLA